MFLHFNFTSISMFSIISLITLNIIWTLRLFFLDQEQSENGHANISVSPAIPKAPQILEYVKCPPQSSTHNLTISLMSLEEHRSAKVSTLAFDGINFEMGRWDNKRLYKMYDFALIGDNFGQASSDSLSCLATQSSVERLNSLTQVARQWSGPLSLAVFVAGSEEFAILQYYVTYMRLCFDFVRSNVTFHIAVPQNQTPTHQKLRSIDNLMDRFECQYPEQTLRRLLKLRNADTIRWRLKHEYPQNHMRNLARKGCQNKFVFLTDIDIIPSENIVPMLNTFLRTVNCTGLCAYVIPTFEVDIRAKFPASKMELLRLYKKGLARPFHEKVFIYNQYATNFSRWISSIQSNAAIYVSHTVTNFEFLYEPFYVALDSIPAHDERFLGYGFTRNSQVYEMYVAGYTFYVLSPVFSCHWGLQQKKSRPAWREQQNNMNRKRFEIFKNEIYVRYKNDPLLMFASKTNGRGR